MSATGYLKRLGRRLTEDLDTLDAEEISQESKAAGARSAADCVRGEDAVMQGELRSVETCSKAAKTGVAAEFFDGSGTVTLKWMGRHRIPGIEPGRKLVVRGRVGEKDGRKVMYNPYYELLGDE